MNLLDLSPALLRGSIHGSIVLIAVFVACRFVPRLPAWTKCWLWRLAWLRVIVAFATAESLHVQILSAPNPTPLPIAFTNPITIETDVPNVPTAASISMPPARNYSLSDYLTAGWLLGVLLMLIRLAYHWRCVHRLRSEAVECEESKLIDQLSALSCGLKLRSPNLLVSSRITKPLLTGIFKPAIVLPPAVLSLSDRNIELILKHEIAHLKRRDLAWNLFAAVAHTLLWFNPLTWICERESHFTQEAACDELALRGQTNRAPEFANLLVEIAAQRERAPQLLTVSIIRTANTLERRLKAMKIIHRKGPGRLIATFAVALALAPALVPWRAVAQKSEEENPAPTATTNANIPSEESLIAEETKIARRELEEARRAHESGRISSEEVIAKRREVLKLEREAAALRNDTAKIRESLTEEIKDVEQLQSAARKRIEVGAATLEEKSKIDRELLRLQRQLAVVDRQSPAPAPTNGIGAGNMSMMYYMSNPELMKRYFPQMYAMMMKNGGITNLPQALSPPNNSAQQSFQDRLNKANSERSIVFLRPRRPGVVVGVAVKAGDHVKMGQELVLLDDRESKIRLRAAESEYEIAETDHALKGKELENALKFQLAQSKNSPDEFKKSLQQDYELKLKRLDSELRLASIKVEQARLELEDHTIRAPSDGSIGTVPIVGQTISENASAVEFSPDPQK